MSTNPIVEEINDVYTGLLVLSKLFAQSNPKDTQQMCHKEWRKRGICTQNAYNTGTKGTTKSYHCMSCSPNSFSKKTNHPPLRQICTGACTPPQIPKSRQGGTADRWGLSQHLPNPQPTYHNLPWEMPTRQAKGISVVGHWFYREAAQWDSIPTLPRHILSFLGASLVCCRQLRLLSTLPQHPLIT